MADTGVAMVSVATPSEKVCACNQQRLVAQRAKITLKYMVSACVGLGAVLKDKLVAVCDSKSW